MNKNVGKTQEDTQSLRDQAKATVLEIGSLMGLPSVIFDEDDNTLTQVSLSDHQKNQKWRNECPVSFFLLLV